MKKTLLFFALSLVVLMPIASFAVVEDSFVYSFHLYYDGANLVKDRDYKTAYDLIADEFEAKNIDKQGFYGELLDASDTLVMPFSVENLNVGKNTIRAPYVGRAQKAIFYGPGAKRLLVVSVVDNAICKYDGNCNQEAGETWQNCPSDCKTPPVDLSKITELDDTTSYQDNDEVLKDTESKEEGGSSGVWFVMTGGVVILLIAAGALLWMRKTSIGKESSPTKSNDNPEAPQSPSPGPLA